MCVALLIPLMAGQASAGAVSFSSARDALKQGISAYQGGYFEIAIPALEYAAAEREFMAEYYLARIYADNSGPHTDHAKAYMLFRKIVDENVDADPDDDPRAPYVGKALTALAGYVRMGIKEIGVKPDLERAVFYLRNASTTFGDEDAQFELAKLQLRGEGVDVDEAMGRHWLADLSKRGHAGAQAFLADLLWRGKYMKEDKALSLALIAIAVENTPVHDRLWIEDIYQNIFCGSGEGIRKQATGIVAEWGNRYGRKPEVRETSNLGLLTAEPERTCQNGEPVGQIRLIEPEIQAAPLSPRPASGFVYGRTSPGGLRDVGTTAPPPPRDPMER